MSEKFYECMVPDCKREALDDKILCGVHLFFELAISTVLAITAVAVIMMSVLLRSK